MDKLHIKISNHEKPPASGFAS